MKFELEQKDLYAIASTVVELLRPLLEKNGTDVDGIFTVEELCQYLKVDSGWVYQQVHSKDIPFLKAGRLLRFRKSDIDGYLIRMSKKDF